MAGRVKHIGVDFDNTIVCYDQLFHQVAVEQGLVPHDVPPVKGQVRDYLRQHGMEDAWIELQGRVYGVSMQRADPFPGVKDFLHGCLQRGIQVHVISHKTLHPFKGPHCDLHQASHQWLEGHGFYDKKVVGLDRKNVFFELTKEGKLARIRQQGCSYFIDDLPEFLAEPGFPAGVQRVLFDPGGGYPRDSRFRHVSSWKEMREVIGC